MNGDFARNSLSTVVDLQGSLMKTDRVFGLFRVGLVVALLAGWVPAGLGQAPPVFEDDPAVKTAPVKPPPPPVRPTGPRVLPAPTAPPRVIPRVPVMPRPGGRKASGIFSACHGPGDSSRHRVEVG